MKDLFRPIPTLLVTAALITGCGSMQNTTAVRDDVYFMPSDEPVTASSRSSRTDVPAKPDPQEVERMEPVEDYYDPGTAAQEAQRGFYDMTYNDPYYYNYGRFGFGTQLGWQNGWNGPGWGMGMGSGWGMGSGFGMGMGWNSGMGWNDPWYSMNMGWGNNFHDPWGWNSPWGWNQPMGWNRPWGWNQPWGWNRPWMNDPWMGGFGPYQGPWGGCMTCYSPVVIGGGSQVVVRPRTGLGGGTRPVSGQPRMITRDPAGLRPAMGSAAPGRQITRPATGTRPAVQPRNGDRTSPGIQREPGTRPTTRPTPRPTTPSRDGGRPTIQRELPSRGGSMGGGSAAPSRDGGGGSGGSRSGGGSRPR
jgi:hypothetical protein